MKKCNDFITNSSSTCFVLNRKKLDGTYFSPKEFREIMEPMINLFSDICVDLEIQGECLTFDEIFGDIYMYNWELSPLLCSNFGYETEENSGKTLVMSADDNTVPCSISEMVKNIFEAERFHLG